MKKITEKEAMNLLKNGQTVTCQYSSKGMKIVKNIPELLRLKKLSKEGIQSFILFDNEQNITIPDNAKVLSLENAIKKLAKDKTHQATFYFKTIEHAEQFDSYNKLMALYQSATIRGLNFVIYEVC